MHRNASQWLSILLKVVHQHMGDWGWLLRRYWYWWLFVLASFGLGITYEPTRWGIVTNAWSVFVAGTAVWLLLEGHGDAYGRRRWLRRHFRDLKPALETILNVAGLTAAFALGLPNDVQLRLRQGASRAARAQAAAEALQFANELAEGASHSATQRIEQAHLLVPDLAIQAQTVDEMVSRNLGLLLQLTDLHGAVQRYSTACRVFLGSSAGQGQPPSEIGRAVLRYVLPEVGRSAIALCETCSDIYLEAEALPKD